MSECQQGGSRDNVDGLPDFQVNIDQTEMEHMLHGSDGATFIRRFDGLLRASDINSSCPAPLKAASATTTRQAASCSGTGSLEDVQAGAGRPKKPNLPRWSRVRMFVRRYSANTRPWFPFHCDNNAYTANVALSSASDHEGGALLCLAGGALQSCVRELGAATVHGGDVCHAVTPVTSGTRYALLIFFHEAAARKVWGSVEEAAAAAAALDEAHKTHQLAQAFSLGLAELVGPQNSETGQMTRERE
jgi:hypothetical protein